MFFEFHFNEKIVYTCMCTCKRVCVRIERKLSGWEAAVPCRGSESGGACQSFLQNALRD